MKRRNAPGRKGESAIKAVASEILEEHVQIQQVPEMAVEEASMQAAIIDSAQALSVEISQFKKGQITETVEIKVQEPAPVYSQPKAKASMEIISAIRKPVLVAPKPQKASGGCCVVF